MTKRYALSHVAMVADPPDPNCLIVRTPTYPVRHLAFRRYPRGWWVLHQGLDFVGRVEYSDERVTKIVDGALFHTISLTSCTARQVAALESSPVAASGVVRSRDLCAMVGQSSGDAAP